MNTISSEVLISSVLGNSQMLDGGSMFGNAPRAVWEKWYQPDELGRVPLACRCMLVEWAGKKILCETGIGCFFSPELATRFGVQEEQHVLMEQLKRLGITHEEIDYVVLSHLHFDHAGGLLPCYEDIQAGNDALLFPNAKYVVGKEAYQRSKEPHRRDRASFIPGLSQKLQESGRLIVVEGDRLEEEFSDRLTFRYTSGHTPGQMHTVVHGQTSKVVFAGDLIPGTAWVHLPITMGYDRYPELLIDEKEELYKSMSLENGNWFVFFTHDPEICCGKVVCNEKSRYVLEDARPSLERFSI